MLQEVRELILTYYSFLYHSETFDSPISTVPMWNFDRAAFVGCDLEQETRMDSRDFTPKCEYYLLIYFTIYMAIIF